MNKLIFIFFITYLNALPLYLKPFYYFKTMNLSKIEQKFLNYSKISKFGGKFVAKRRVFNPNYRDYMGRTNVDRMKQGLAPIGKDGKSIELHHLKQKDNGVIIEMTRTEHNKYSSTLHRYTKESEIDRYEFEKWKRAYWRSRANDFYRVK